MTRGTNNLAGISTLNKNPKIIGKNAIAKHVICSWIVNGTVLKDWPPN